MSNLTFGQTLIVNSYPHIFSGEFITIDERSQKNWASLGGYGPPKLNSKFAYAEFVGDVDGCLIVKFSDNTGLPIDICVGSKDFNRFVNLVGEDTRLWAVNGAGSYVHVNREVSVRRPKKKDDGFPHSCPACKSRAYIGFNKIECVGINCKNYATFRCG